MRNLFACFLALCAATVALAAPHAARADAMHAAMNENLCMDWNVGTNQIALCGCNGGYNQTFFTTNYDPQAITTSATNVNTRPGTRLSLDSGSSGVQLTMAPCVGGKPSQQWSLVNDNSAPGALRNQAGWCADIPYGIAASGRPINAYACKWGTAWMRANPVWTRVGGNDPISAISAQYNIPYTVLVGLPAGSIISPFKSMIFEPGGQVLNFAGNIVAQGGGNYAQIDGGGFMSR